MGNKDPLYTPGNYNRYVLMPGNRKPETIFVYIPESLCCPHEINTILQINSTSVFFLMMANFMLCEFYNTTLFFKGQGSFLCQHGETPSGIVE